MSSLPDAVTHWEPRLWNVANAVVAFVLAQSLVSGYQFGQETFKANFRERGARVKVIALLIAVTAGEIWIVILCGQKAVSLLSDANVATAMDAKSLWCLSTYWRVAAIAFFALAPLFGILGAAPRSHDHVRSD